MSSFAALYLIADQLAVQKRYIAHLLAGEKALWSDACHHLESYLRPKVFAMLVSPWPLIQTDIAFYCWRGLFDRLVRTSGFQPYVPVRARPGFNSYACAPLFSENDQPFIGSGIILTTWRQLYSDGTTKYDRPVCLKAVRRSFRLIFSESKGIAYVTFMHMPYMLNNDGFPTTLDRTFDITVQLPKTLREATGRRGGKTSAGCQDTKDGSPETNLQAHPMPWYRKKRC